LINLFRRGRIDSDLAEEMSSHIAEAIEHGRPADEARRAFGPSLQLRERSRDLKLFPWLDALLSDVVFGWRQLRKHRAASAAAILSLALAIGATTAAFRLVDAVLMRPLPVAEPGSLYYVATTFIDRNGLPDYSDDFDYPSFREYRAAAGDRAELMVIGHSYQQDASFGSAGVEKVYPQLVSGNVFGVLGVQPAVGRLLTPEDDRAPGGYPLAVLSYGFWSRRFARDPGVIGKKFRLGSRQFEIVGVAAKGFTGTEPGAMTDIFIPSTMNTEALNSPGWSWLRIWFRPKAGTSSEQVRQQLQSVFTRQNQERVKYFSREAPRHLIEAALKAAVLIFPAAAGASDLQREYRRPLVILAVLVGLVLLVACANVANLLTAQAASRAREMALRVSIGAGQGRLVQLVLVQSALLAAAASAAGMVFSWWSAPLVVSMLAPAETPVRLALDADWRAVGFGIALTVAVTLLFGTTPALRASAVNPLSALKGGDSRSRSGVMRPLIAAQVALCVTVLFVAGLFAATFQRLSSRPLGFSHERVVILAAEAAQGQKLPAQAWEQVADHLRQAPGVESATLAAWPLMSDNHWTADVRVPGRARPVRAPYCLDVAPRFFDAMRIKLIGGREFRSGDVPPRQQAGGQVLPGVGIVNETFAGIYFDGQNPVGRSVDFYETRDQAAATQIVGYVRDAAYGDLREPIRPTIYIPMEDRGNGTFLVRTAGDPRALAATLRREVSRARPELSVVGVEMQSALVGRHMIRERLLATLSLFFAIVALVLAGVGLYGVLNYSVVQQRRELGIRLALGARSYHVVRRIGAGLGAMVCAGVALGIAGGVACARFVESLLYEVKSTNPAMIAAPVLALLIAAVLAGLAPAVRAVRIDPAETLRSE
jgi:predicted permease